MPLVTCFYSTTVAPTDTFVTPQLFDSPLQSHMLHIQHTHVFTYTSYAKGGISKRATFCIALSSSMLILHFAVGIVFVVRIFLVDTQLLERDEGERELDQAGSAVARMVQDCD